MMMTHAHIISSHKILHYQMPLIAKSLSWFVTIVSCHLTITCHQKLCT